MDLDSLKTLAVNQGLVVLDEGATLDKARRISLYYGRTCLCASENIQLIEHYLFGFRDGRTTPHPDAHDAERLANDLSRRLEQLVIELPRLVEKADEVADFIAPYTRERS